MNRRPFALALAAAWALACLGGGAGASAEGAGSGASAPGAAPAASGPAFPARAAVRALACRVADYQAPRSLDGGNTWETATFFAGLAAAHRLTGDPRHLAWCLRWAERNGWDRGASPADANDQCCGQTYLELYFLKRDPARVRGIRRDFDAEIAGPYPRPVARPAVWGRPARPSALHGYRGRGWHWCDALFMAPPVLARLGAATGEKKYFDYLHRMWRDTAAALYDPAEHLFYRDGRYSDLTLTGGRKVFWSRGNGWVLAGTARVLEYLPADDPERARYVDLLRAMAEAVARCQGDDGLWRTDLLAPEAYPDPETSGSAFFCYALAWGLNRGLLPAERFRPVVAAAWAALERSVSAEGRLLGVQPPAYEPERGPFDNRRDLAARDGSTRTVYRENEYGAGALLLAASEVARPDGERK
jgi:rhamnogalacturonyl hydrolase YesR